jgi:hypothetical protein
MSGVLLLFGMGVTLPAMFAAGLLIERWLKRRACLRHRRQRVYRHCDDHLSYDEYCVWCSIANNARATAEEQP